MEELSLSKKLFIPWSLQNETNKYFESICGIESETFEAIYNQGGRIYVHKN